MKLITVIKQHRRKLSDNTEIVAVCERAEKAECILGIAKKRLNLDLNGDEMAEVFEKARSKNEFKLPYEEKDYTYYIVIGNVLIFEDGKFIG